MSMNGKCALVTGGSRGIGRAICTELARRGASVIINCAGNVEAAEETAELCRNIGNGKFVVMQANISDAMQSEMLIKSAAEELGRIDILINNAGITRDNLVLRMSESDWDKVLNTNLKAVFMTVKAACRIMVKQRYGRIVNISSIVGLRGNAGQANYAASKAGIIGFTKSIAKEFAARNITANVVAPGYIDTDMTKAMPESARKTLLSSIPMARAGSVKEVAAAAAFFAEEESGYITGQVLCVDGGMGV